ncbi:MAG: Fe-S cluster assembly protein IscX [Verrucomicrobiae bacterium]|nr:Fe-S cluster assembly protein IscX [Verrucomicrobiae bacterium]MCP5521897.1 Fe-S cluster assembly protein IscX [Verrucomicrobiales bacterium]
MKLTWHDTDEIAWALAEEYPDQDPLKLSFPSLHRMVTQLDDFGDRPDRSSEAVLEAIQMAWYDEVK